MKALEYQWNKVLIPYWKKTVAFAKSHGVTRIALEMHPGFCVYNPETLLKLRRAVGPVIGANFDPSHLFWQGIDPVSAIRYLGDAIQYFHAKDTKVDSINAARIGVLDTKHYGDEINRAWVFRSVGYGHDAQVWKDIISALRMVGYDDVISIEHEDSLMSQNEGLMKAVTFLKDVITFEDRGAMWWA
jgi:sugar phosphate isomerase/epimerase